MADAFEEHDNKKRLRTEQSLFIQPDGTLLDHIQKGTDPQYTLAKLYRFATAAACEPADTLAIEAGSIKLTTKLAPIKDEMQLLWAVRSHAHWFADVNTTAEKSEYPATERERRRQDADYWTGLIMLWLRQGHSVVTVNSLIDSHFRTMFSNNRGINLATDPPHTTLSMIEHTAEHFFRQHRPAAREHSARDDPADPRRRRAGTASTTTCGDFNNGKCTRGANCRFRHHCRRCDQPSCTLGYKNCTARNAGERTAGPKSKKD